MQAPGGRAEMQPDATSAKANLRVQLQRRRLSTTGHQRRLDDNARLIRLFDLLDAESVLPMTRPDGDGASLTVALYLSKPPEPDTVALAVALCQRGFNLLVPAPGTNGTWAQPAWANYAEPIRPGAAGIPVSSGVIARQGLAQVDVIVMPGLAGSLDGPRLGTGGGWYDRALSSASSTARRWLVLNDWEVLASLPRQSHDIPVDRIITPTRTLVTHPTLG